MFCNFCTPKPPGRKNACVNVSEASAGSPSKVSKGYQEMLAASKPSEMRLTKEMLAAEQVAFLRSVMSKSAKLPAHSSRNPLAHTVIKSVNNKRYALYNRLTAADCEEIEKKTGHRFSEGPCVVGEGGFGRIRFARDEETGEILAVKKLANYERPGTEKRVVHSTRRLEMGQECLIQRVLPDSQSVLKARDMAVVPVDTFCPELVKAYLFYPYLPHSDLESGLQRLLLSCERGLPRQHAIDLIQCWVSDMVDGVAALHENGLYHLDIKSNNFMLDKTGHLLLGDFGLATRAEFSDRSSGTRFFIAPEVQDSAQHPYSCEKADLYSLGRAIEYLSWMLEAVQRLKPFRADEAKGCFFAANSFFQDYRRPVAAAARSLYDLGHALANPDPAQRAALSHLRQNPLFSSKPKGMRVPESERQALFEPLSEV